MFVYVLYCDNVAGMKRNKICFFPPQILNLYYSRIMPPSMKLPLHTIAKTCIQYVQLLRFGFHGDGSEC